jgi:8-oxo-dGTP diphosphatase
VSEVEIVQAAGGVVVRDGAVAVVHRPKYDDWSLPKGKLDAGEAHEAAALREVEEETGLRCRLGRELDSVSYRDRKGRPKMVRYWLMEVLDGEFAVNDEVDELRWLEQDEAGRQLTHEHDRELVRSAGGLG